MSTNRFTRFSPQSYISTVIPLPFEEILKVGAIKQERQDMAQAEIAKLDAGVKSVHALPGDKDYAQKAISEISSNIDQFTNMDFNDPSVRSNWNKTKSQIAQRFMPTGDLGMIETNYNLGMNWQKSTLDSGQKAGWGSDQLSGFTNRKLSNFKTLDDNGNTIMFQGEGVSNRVDYNEWISKALKDIAADQNTLGLSKAYTGNSLYDGWRSGTIEVKDRAKITNALAMRAKGDQILKDSLNQEANFRGFDRGDNFISGVDKEGNVVINNSNPFGLMLSGAAYGAAYTKLDDNYEIRTNPLAEHEGSKIPFKLPGTLPTNLQKDEIDIVGGGFDAVSTGFNMFLGAAQYIGGSIINDPKVTNLGKDRMNKTSNNTQLRITTNQPPLTSEQNKVVEKAAGYYGTTVPSGNKEKAELYNKYVNDWNTKEVNIGINQYTNEKQIESLNKIYFSPDQKGANNAANTEFTLIGGNADKAKGTGNETILDQFGDSEKYTISIFGELNPDNPIYATGQVVQVRNNSTGKIEATYAMETPLADDNAQYSSKVIHNASRAKYNLNEESYTSIYIGDDQQGKPIYQTYKVEYSTVTDQNSLTDKGKPVKQGDSYKFTPVDDNNQPVGESKTYNSLVDWYNESLNSQQ